MSDDKTPASENQKDDQEPGEAEGGLLVADLYVAPDEEIHQLAEAPQLAPVDADPALVGADDHLGRVGVLRVRGDHRRLGRRRGNP